MDKREPTSSGKHPNILVTKAKEKRYGRKS